MNTPLFTTIIPVYNVAAYLSHAVDSVLGQNYSGDVEIILVDDGSTDNSGKICDNYAAGHPQMKVIHKKKWWSVQCTECRAGYCHWRIHRLSRQ